MLSGWKIYAALGLVIVLGALAWAADHYRHKAKIEAMRADAAEEKLARAEKLLDGERKQGEVLRDAIAKKDAAKVKVVKQIEVLEKEIKNDPQAGDPAPRVIRRALGRLPE